MSSLLQLLQKTNPRTFISFDCDNNENEKNLFSGQAKNSKTPFNIQDWSSKTPLPQKLWESWIEEKISKCQIMIVLVGKSMATADGVDKEISFAKTHDVPFFGVYVGGANSYSILPVGLQRNRTIDWDWANIAAAINQVMTEGKNS